METQVHHEELIAGVAEQFRSVLDGSEQGIYIYLDDVHKVSNERFAALLGYASAKEWAAVRGSSLETFVDAGSQEALATAFRKAVDRYLGSYLEVTWKKKEGSRVKTKVILVPIVFQKHVFALHFVF
jgi:PAS domain-containing protein